MQIQITPMGWVAMVAGIVFYFLIFFPLVKILHRTGHSGWWSVLAVMGPGLIVGLWLFAYCRWPAFDRPKNAAHSN
jgi:hypothetical protein